MSKGAVSFAAHIIMDTKKEIGQIAQNTQKAISSRFPKVGKMMQSALMDPAKKASQNVGKSLEGIKKSVQSVADSSKGMLDPAVEGAKLKVKQLERELSSVNEKLDAMRDKKRGELSSFYGNDTKGLNKAVDSSLSKDKDYTKLVAQSDKVNNKLMAADDKLNLAKQVAAQKTAQKKQAAEQKAAQQTQKIVERAKQAAEKAADQEAKATEKAELKKRKARQKTLINMTSGLSNGLKSMTKGVSKQVGGMVKGVGQKVGGLAKSIKSAFKSAILMAGLYAAFRSLKDMMGNLIDQNAQLKTSLNQIKGNIQAAFMPIVQFVMPAVTALAQGLSVLTKKMAEFTSSFFGTTYKQSVTAVKSLKNTQKEVKKTATLAGIDEINNIGQSDEDTESSDSGTDFGALNQGYGDPSQIVQNIQDTLTQIAETIPAFIASMMTKLAEAAPQFAQTAADIINAFLGSLNEHWPEISQAGIKILTSLLDGLISISPQLGTTAANIVSTLLEAIITAAPKLLEAGILFLENFLNGLSEKLPDLIPKMQEGIRSMLNTINEHLPQILNAGIDILLALINGLIETLPEIIPAVVQAISTLRQALTDHLPEIIQAGVNLLLALVQGVLNSLDVILEEAPKIIESLVEGLIEAIPILLAGAADLVKALIDAIMNTDWLQVGKDILSAIFDGIMRGFTKIKDFFSWDNIKAMFTGGDVKVPSFASGGIVDQPTLAMVGDNRRSPEAITPLHDLYGLVKNAVAAGGQGNGSDQQPVNFVLNVGGTKIMEWFAGGNKVSGRRNVNLGTT